MHTSFLLIYFNWISWKMQTITVWFFFYIVLNCFDGISHNKPWSYKKAVQRLRCANVLQLQKFDKFYYSELFCSNVLTRTGRSQMVLFLLSCLSWRSLLSYMIVKQCLSKRPFTTNNTITMTIIILTFYLLSHFFSHHLKNNAWMFLFFNILAGMRRN